MKHLKQSFTDSAKELKKLTTIVLTALLIAIGILLGQFSVQLTPQIKLAFRLSPRN